MASKFVWASVFAAVSLVLGTQVGVAQLAGGEHPIVQMDKSGAPKFSSVSKDVWCRAISERNLADYQQHVVELVAIGGQVHGANYVVLPNKDGAQWIAVVCGKIQEPE